MELMVAHSSQLEGLRGKIIETAAVFGLICAGVVGCRSEAHTPSAPTGRSEARTPSATAIDIRALLHCVPFFYKGLTVVISHARAGTAFNVQFAQVFRNGGSLESSLGAVHVGREGWGRIRDRQPFLADPGRGRVFLFKYGYDGPHANLLVVNKAKECKVRRHR